eukprot:6178589-Pleurochrysis_carterae.AAC.1
MHSSANCSRIACVFAERPRSAPQALRYLCSQWLPLPAELPFPEPPHRRAQPLRLRPLSCQ